MSQFEIQAAPVPLALAVRLCLMLGGKHGWSGAVSTKKKGMAAVSGEWREHLRWHKRYFWKRERQAERHDIASRVREGG